MFAVVMLLVVLSSAQSSGLWLPTIYKVEERISELKLRLEEVKDQQRHYMDEVDRVTEDLEQAITKKDKLIIGRRLTHLRSRLVVYHSQKLALVRAIRKAVHSIPKRLRNRVIRKLKLETYFKEVRAITSDVYDILNPKTTVAHKSSTKKTLKNMGHGIAKQVRL